ncbi:MAG: hypothetical protein ACLFPJ_03125 [Candidatus Woesearchaeota archaeon]
MKFKTKSIIVGRMKREDKDDDLYPCFVSLFDINDPHKTAEVPKEQIKFDKLHKIILKDLNMNYLLAGNDIVINDLESVELIYESPHLTIKGIQN